MARTRREKTLADYVVIAISPALIMALVGSLVYFLLEVVYRGDYASRIQWVLACFVFGAVLVARIGIEQGTDQAKIFGAALLLAAGVFALKFVDAFVIAWVLLAVISWCSWKLTWDCTLIDDEEDASGEGLLQAAGIDDGLRGKPPQPSSEKANGAAAESSARERRAPDRLARETGRSAPGESRLADDLSDAVASGIRAPVPQISASSSGLVENSLRQQEKLAEVQKKSKARPHAPGLWVVYFSLAALPLFGIGQLLIPAQEGGRRNYAFQLLAGYVASALGLLLTTSFLGLRRYLRQRKLQMPAAMTGTWLGMGTALAVAVLAVALLIPRPQGEYTVTSMIDKLDQQVRDASKFAVLGGDRGQGEGRKIGKQDPDADQAGAEKQGQGQKAEVQQAGEKEDKSGENKANESGEEQEPTSEEGQSENEPEESSEEKADGGTRQGQKPGGGEGQGQSKDQKQGQQQQPQSSGNQGKDKQPEQKDGKAQPQKPPQGRDAGKQPPANAPPPASAPQPPPASSFLQQVAPFFKWLIYGILAAFILYIVVRHWGAISSYLAKLWAEFLSLFGFRPDGDEGAVTPSEKRAPRPKSYADFDNPFTTGTARRMKPAQLLEYSFQALEAWAGDRGIRRSEDTTPLEFAQDVSRRSPGLGQDVARTAQLYVQVAYAKKTPSAESLDVLERLWRQMDSEGTLAPTR